MSKKNNLSEEVLFLLKGGLINLNLQGIMFAYLVINKSNPSIMFCASTYPAEWQDVYVREKYQFIDPVVLTAMRRNTPFAWSECISMQERTSLTKVFTRSARKGITGGYTFILHDFAGNLAMLSFLISDGDLETRDSVIQEKGRVLELLGDVHEKYLQKTIDAPSDTYHKYMFTKREHEVLYWASLGKTNTEIGLILGISLSTVKFHFNNITKKLGVTTPKHAIRIGVEFGLILSL